MELVGSGLGHHIHYAARRVAELGGHDARLHLELLNCVHGRVHVDVSGARVHVGTAVQHQVVGAAGSAVDAEPGNQHPAVSEPVRRFGVGSHIGSQHHQRQSAAAVERQAEHPGILDNLAHGSRRSVDQRQGSRYFHRFGDGADLKLEIHAGLIAHLDHDAGAHAAFEPLLLGHHGVAAHRYSGHQEVSGFVGCRSEDRICFGLRDPDGDALDHRLLGIGHGTLNRSPADLCPTGRGDQHGAYQQCTNSRHGSPFTPPHLAH